jgi:hypothetical protein
MIERAPNTYEQLRDEATGEGANAWREADRLAANLRATYAGLKEDPRYTEEHRAEQAWAAYEAAEGKIAANKAKARELLQKQSRTNEKLSFPFPDQEVLTTTDTSKLIASQNEASRVVRKLDRTAANAKGPFTRDRAEVLRDEYGRGLEVGGVSGGAICRGVLAAAEELGMDVHGVVDGFRKDRHREALERAEHYARLTDMIGGKAPEPPFTKPGSGRGSDFHTGRSRPLFVDRGRTVEGSRRPGRRAPWK